MSERITTHTLRNLDHMCVLYPTPVTTTMSEQNIPHCSLNHFYHSDCMIAGIPLQVTPSQLIYVISSSSSHPLLHLLQSLKKPRICVWKFGLMAHLEQFTSRHHICSSPLLAASHSESFIRWRVGDDTHFLLTKEVL